MATVTVIIPTFNRAHILKKCLDSVLSQTRTVDEIIVVDDGSTDNTATFIQEQYPSVQYLYQKNQGVSAARNSGIETAKGDWIALLDSDDEWLPDKLNKQLTALKQNPEYFIVHTNELWIHNGKPKNQKQKHRKYGGHIFEKCLPLCVISPSSVIIHRSVFENIGMFDHSLPACEDYDLWLRITARLPVLFIDEELIIKHGGHDDQLSQKHWGMDRFRIKAIQKILETDILSDTDRTAAIKMLLRKISIYLEGAKKHHNNELVSEFTQLSIQYSKS